MGERARDRTGPGRPRTPGVERAVVEAALRVLALQGLENFSVAKVAAEAGTTKATVYSRYPNRMGLIGAALAHLRVEGLPEPVGDVRRELVQLLDHMAAQYERIGGMSIVGSCLATEQRMPELLDTIRESTFRPRRQTFIEALRRGQQAGQIRAEIELEQVVSGLIGAYYGDWLAGLDAGGPGWSERVVDLNLAGIAHPSYLRDGTA